MYDPTVGQFLSEDPFMFDGLDENLRRYVKNSPLNATDPTGLIPYDYYNPDELGNSSTITPDSTVGQAEKEFENATTIEGKLNVGVAIANSIFAGADVEIIIKRFAIKKDLPPDAVNELFGSFSTAKKKIEQLQILAEFVQEVSISNKASTGVLATDFRLLSSSGLANGCNLVKKSTKEGGVSQFKRIDIIGGIILDRNHMNLLTLAEELRDRIMLSDIDKAGATLGMVGAWNDKDKKLCDLFGDNRDKFREGASAIGESVGKRIVITIYMLDFPIGAK